MLGDNLEGLDDGEGREVQEGGDICILMVVVQQKSTQHSKVIISEREALPVTSPPEAELTAWTEDLSSPCVGRAGS